MSLFFAKVIIRGAAGVAQKFQPHLAAPLTSLVPAAFACRRLTTAMPLSTQAVPSPLGDISGEPSSSPSPLSQDNQERKLDFIQDTITIPDEWLSLTCNEVTLVGRLGQIPTMVETKRGDSAVVFHMITELTYGGRDSERTNKDWHHVVCYGDQFSHLLQMHKGKKVVVRGLIRYGDSGFVVAETVNGVGLVSSERFADRGDERHSNHPSPGLNDDLDNLDELDNDTFDEINKN